jgi:glycosyltransferase involved in cell wall biosynthesis
MISDMHGVKLCGVVIPCLDEGAVIGSLVEQVRRHVPTVFVVDDGSRDNTAAAASAAGAEVLRHSSTSGKGAALATGLTAAAEKGFAWGITMDGDGQHSPDDIPAFLARAEETGARLVVGNRMHQAQAIPWLRRLVNRWMSRRLSKRAGVTLPDSQCGFRLLDLKAWAGLRLTTRHFEVESETLIAFVMAGHRIEFVPIRVIGRGAKSHIHPIIDSVRWWRWWRKGSQK